eukprot:CAMPEP_0184462986 /NCGR_PEP_ID=MMETSP0740-20130409/50548_1 /TAXON_ID=385413 /ORGANISM="Thalassiosira miniscula, Strain CCMP1093" /LENGTH=131 /DNA_ID=CAMNT_0026837063 /DNA_START=1 /DNA_END=394 /DNA_ORIENTATION=+
MHFAESAHSFAPPSHLFAHSIIHGDNTAGMGNNNNSPVGQGSVMHYADAGLSMELRGLLNGSNLVDPSASQQSFTGSLVPIEDTGASILDIRADHQYMWLDRITPKELIILKIMVGYQFQENWKDERNGVV